MVFVEAKIFSRFLYDYLCDEEYGYLQEYLSANPTAGSVIPGTGGIRKIRYISSVKKKGKRSGLRIIYYWYPEKDQIFLMTVYYKGETTDLTPDDKRYLKEQLRVWKNEQT